MMRVTILLLACLLAACGDSQDDSGGVMMEDGSGAMEAPGMEQDASTDGMMDDDSAMARDTTDMQRP